jgi:signal transduction histidine kinase
VALAWRRVFPIACVLVVSLCVGLEASLGVPVNEPVVPLLGLVIALYSVAANEPLTRALIGFAMYVPGFALALTNLDGGPTVKAGNFLFGLVIGGGAWVAGLVVRSRTQRVTDLTGEADKLKHRAKELEAERLEAVAAERARIARELHDVIAHSVSVMVVQAEAGEAVLLQSPERALEPLRAVQQTGRQAMVEMSRLLGLLRDHGDEIGLAPQPGLRDLDDLVAQVRSSGLPVEVRFEGTQREVPLGVDLAAYRVLQEALTNTLKHAGDPATAVVVVRYGRDTLELEVSDNGASNGTGHIGGHGLVGMQERVNVFGGELVAGPRPEGGFRVRAQLPLSGATG